MRRRLGVAAVVALVGALAAGCGAAEGTDGDLTDDWRAIAAAEQFTPEAGRCHLIDDPTSYLSSYEPVDCTRAHLVETFHVGTFTGDLAARPSPPRVGSAAMRPAFVDCDARAKAFVGAEWRAARLAVQVAPPSPNGWAGGSRWYRCDIFEVDGINDYERAVQRSGSLRGALQRPGGLAYGCLEPSRAGIPLPVACDRPHHYEFAGIWTAPDGRYADLDRDEKRIHVRCREVIARYAKVPVDGLLAYRTGTWYRQPSEEAWARGDRGIRCFLWSDDRALTRSVRGGGTKALPVR